MEFTLDFEKFIKDILFVEQLENKNYFKIFLKSQRFIECTISFDVENYQLDFKTPDGDSICLTSTYEYESGYYKIIFACVNDLDKIFSFCEKEIKRKHNFGLFNFVNSFFQVLEKNVDLNLFNECEGEKNENY